MAERAGDRRGRIAVVALGTALGMAAGAVRAGLDCPGGALLESEPCGSNLNGGCAGTPPPITVDAACGETWCGVAWADGDVRDTDWYRISVADPDADGEQTVRATLVSEFSGVCVITAGLDICQPFVLGSIGCGAGGANTGLAVATVPAPATYDIFVAPGTCSFQGIFNGVACGSGNNGYTVAIDCGAACPGDFDGNLAVDVGDLVEVILAWGDCTQPPPLSCPNDTDGNGAVDVGDLVNVILAWGPCP